MRKPNCRKDFGHDGEPVRPAIDPAQLTGWAGTLPLIENADG